MRAAMTFKWTAMAGAALALAACGGKEAEKKAKEELTVELTDARTELEEKASALGSESSSMSTLPLTRSGMASAVPRYGMWTRKRLDSALKYSVVSWTMEPLPLLA